MSLYWLVNTTRVGTTRYLAGSSIDDAQVDISKIQAAGGNLWLQGASPLVDAAADRARKARLRGENEASLESIMTVGVDAAQGVSESAGQTTLVAGVSPVISARITSTTVVLATLRVPGNGALTVKFAALDSDRVVGAPGSFRLRALLADGTPNNADTSTLDYVVRS